MCIRVLIWLDQIVHIVNIGTHLTAFDLVSIPYSAYGNRMLDLVERLITGVLIATFKWESSDIYANLVNIGFI